MNKYSDNSERIVVFMDILGFKNSIKKETSLEKIAIFIENISSLNRPFQTNAEGGGCSLFAEVSSYSDNIIISYPLEDPNYGIDTPMQVILIEGIIQMVIKTQLYALSMGILLRGGVTIGQCIHKNNVVFGKALIEAIELEEAAAIYPRVILSTELTKKLGLKESPFGLIKDNDGLYYIDYLKDMIYTGLYILKYPEDFQKFREVIVKGIHEAPDSAKRAKWCWLATYFNTAIDFWKKYGKGNVKEIINSISLITIDHT